MSNSKVRYRRRRRAQRADLKWTLHGLRTLQMFTGRFDVVTKEGLGLNFKTCERKWEHRFTVTGRTSSGPHLELGRKLHEEITMDAPAVLMNIDYADIERRLLRYGQAYPEVVVTHLGGGKIPNPYHVRPKR